MPTYEYACSSCGNAWEEIQKITEPALEVCPACKKATAKRQISGGSFILKGGGWYADLYSSAKSGGSNGSGAAKSETKGESSAETKKESNASASSTSAAPAPSSGTASKSAAE